MKLWCKNEREESEAMNVINLLQSKTEEDIKLYYENNKTRDAIALINISGDINVGMALRSANLLGVEKVYIVGRKKYDRRGAVGLYRYTPLSFISIPPLLSLTEEELPSDLVIAELKKLATRYTLIFVEQRNENVKLPYIPLKEIGSVKKDVLFIFGNEGKGIDTKVMNAFENVEGIATVEIPQRGVGRSFNVACAVSIVLYERSR